MSTAVPPAKPSRAKAPTFSPAAQFVFGEWKNIETFHALEDLVTEEIDEMLSGAADAIYEALPGGPAEWARNLASGGLTRGHAFRRKAWGGSDVALGVYYDRGHWKHLNLKEPHVFVCVYAPSDGLERTKCVETLRAALEGGDDFDKVLAKLCRADRDCVIECAIRLADDDRTGKKFYEAIVDTFDEVAKAVLPPLEAFLKGS